MYWPRHRHTADCDSQSSRPRQNQQQPVCSVLFLCFHVGSQNIKDRRNQHYSRRQLVTGGPSPAIFTNIQGSQKDAAWTVDKVAETGGRVSPRNVLPRNKRWTLAGESSRKYETLTGRVVPYQALATLPFLPRHRRPFLLLGHNI